MMITKLKIGVGLSILFSVAVGLVLLLIAINDFFNKHYFVFKSPVEVKFNKPIELKERKVKIIEAVREVKNLPEPKTPLEKYICEKFGVADCKIALAVAKAESGMGETKFNINSDGSIDIGIFQINSVHWKKKGCHPKELFDAYRNVDCAYQIWKTNGWDAWTAFNNGQFKNQL